MKQTGLDPKLIAQSIRSNPGHWTVERIQNYLEKYGEQGGKRFKRPEFMPTASQRLAHNIFWNPMDFNEDEIVKAFKKYADLEIWVKVNSLIEMSIIHQIKKEDAHREFKNAKI